MAIEPRLSFPPGWSTGPWAISRPLRETRHAATREIARRRAGRLHPVGFVRVEHETTGESWIRERGQWRLDRAGRAGHLEPEDAA